MIIVCGPGFTGSNAIVKILIQKFNVFMGEEFVSVKGLEKQHPYIVLEDAEAHDALRYKLFAEFLRKRQIHYENSWGLPKL